MLLLRRAVQRLRWAVALVVVAAASLGPRLAWAQGLDNAITFGGTGTDQGVAVAVAPNGDLVVTGAFVNTVDFDPGAGTENRTSAGGFDAFVARYTAAGAFVSVATFGGTDTDVGRGVAVAPNGDAVVTGTFRNTVDFDPGAGDASRTSSGDIDVFVARYSAAGAFVSVATFGSAASDQGFGVAVDASGNAVATGYFQGTVDFDPGAGDASHTSAGGFDAFVARYTAAGAFVSVATFGGTGTDQGFGVAVAPNGDAVATGTFAGIVDFDPGAGDASRASAGGTDAFVARYDAAGAFVSVAIFGSANSEQSRGVAVDASGNAVVTGYFQGTVDFDPGAGDASHTSAGGVDAFVARYTAAGAFVSVATFGGRGTDLGLGVAVAPNGDAVATGYFNSTVDFDPGAGDASRTSAGFDDAFVARYSAAGALVSVVALGSTGSDQGLGVAVDASGNAVVTGYFQGTVDFDPGAGDASHTSAGGVDAFVARYASSGSILPVELTAFAATTSGRTARLSWTTASETNNAGFTVEQQRGEAWTDATGLIAGRGTTSERTDYAAEVTGLTAGRHTFRLRQSDLDGTSVVVGTVTVEVRVGGDGPRVAVLGNGTRRPVVRIEAEGAVRAEAYDVLGRSVGVLVDGAVSGTVEASLPAGVAPGIYAVRVTTAGGRTTSHAVVVR